MLRTIAFGAVFLAAISSADDNATARSVMTSAMQQLASQGAFALEISGKVGLKGYEGTPFQINIITKRKGTTLLLDIGVWERSDLRQQVIADGKTLWAYNRSANTFSSIDYGDPAINQDRPVRFLLSQLGTMLRGKGAFVARFLEDVYRTSASNPWEPFLSMGKATAEMPTKDAPTGYLTFTQGTHRDENSRTSDFATIMEYSFVDLGMDSTGAGFDGDLSGETGSGSYALNRIYMRQNEQSTKGTMQTEWTMRVFRNNFIPTVPFTFVPPKGARVIALPKRITD